MKVNPLAGVMLAALSAALLALAFPGFEMHCLAWVALLPLFILIARCGYRGSFVFSLATGLMFYCALLWWMLGVGGMNPVNFVLANLFNAIYFGVFGLAACYLHKRMPRLDALTFPAVWVIIEYLRAHAAFLSFPWGILGYSQYQVIPVARFSAFAGVYGVSFLVISVNAALSSLLLRYLSVRRVPGSGGVLFLGENKVPVGVLTGVLILFLMSNALYGSLYPSDKTGPGTLKAALVQGSVYVKGRDDARSVREVFDKYRSLTLGAAGAGADLIAWPSSSVPGRIPDDWVMRGMLSGLARQTGGFLLVGSSGYDKFSVEQRKTRRVANSAFLFSPQGRITGRYDKMRLLPFDEYLPLRDVVKWPSWIVSPGMTDFEPGSEMTVFDAGGAKFGVLICWENMFAGQFREMAGLGVDFMVSMTNEGFTDVPAAHYQMLGMNVFRAVENHVAVVRTSTTGVSGIIDPDGRMVAKVRDEHSSDVNVEGFVVGRVPLSSKRTFYSLHGDWFVSTLVFVLGGLVSWSLFSPGFMARWMVRWPARLYKRFGER